MTNRNSFEEWERFLNPDVLRETLIQSALFLASWEILKGSCIEHLKSFYSNGCEFNAETKQVIWKVGPEYKNKVTSLNPKDEFDACCRWFVNSGAISEQDLQEIVRIRQHRNMVAHELPKFIGSIDKMIDRQILKALTDITRKIDIWWLREIELPTNPDFSDDDIESIKWEEVSGGSSMVLGIILSIFDGDDSYLRNIFEQFKDMVAQAKG